MLYGGVVDGHVEVESFLELGEESLAEMLGAGPLPAIGLFRLHARKDEGLTDAELDAFRDIDGTVFLTVKPISVSSADAVVYVRDGRRFGERRILLRADEEARPERPRPSTVIKRRIKVTTRQMVLASTVAVGMAFGVGSMILEPQPVPALQFDVMGSGAELMTSWRVTGVSEDARLQSAQLILRELGKERTIDISNGFRDEGQLRLKPKSSDVAITLRVKHQGVAPMERTLTYVGYETTPANRMAELNALRKRNRELEQLVAGWR
ncbi:MAG: hypothetical protein FJW38_29530 [Acidobacteria bacterium]|nr:hypothetical protein [Acidobacteriota bacterium]